MHLKYGVEQVRDEVCRFLLYQLLPCKKRSINYNSLHFGLSQALDTLSDPRLSIARTC